MTDKPKDRRGAPKGGGVIKPAHGGQIGNRAFIPTDEQRKRVMELVAVGLVHHQIAQLIKWDTGENISLRTLKEHFKEELNAGGLVAIGAVGGAIYRGAMAGNANLMRLYWNINAHRFGLNHEKLKHEHTGANGGPISVIDWSEMTKDMTPEERKVMLPVIQRMIEAAAENTDQAADEDTDSES